MSEIFQNFLPPANTTNFINILPSTTGLILAITPEESKAKHSSFHLIIKKIANYEIFNINSGKAYDNLSGGTIVCLVSERDKLWWSEINEEKGVGILGKKNCARRL